MEGDMEFHLLGQALGGLGTFFLGLAALWFVSVYGNKNKEK
jgi:hypothetical protein